jgi:hypothetical protein
MFAFDLFEGQDPVWHFGGRQTPLPFGRRQPQDGVGRQNDGPFDDVLQLPHIARLGIVDESFHHLGGDRVDAFVQRPRVGVHEVAHQQRDILRPVA